MSDLDKTKRRKINGYKITTPNSNMSPVKVDPFASIESKFRKATLYQLFLFLIYLLIIVGLGFIFLDKNKFEIVFDLPFTLIVGILVLTTINGIVRTWRWIYFSSHLKLSVPVRENALYFVAGFSMLATPAKLGELIRVWFLKKKHAVAYGRSFPLLFAERICDIWAVTILVSLTLFGFGQFREQVIYAVLVFVALSLPLFFPLHLKKLFSFKSGGWLRRPIEFVREVLGTLNEFRSWSFLGIVLLATVAGWLVETYGFYLLLHELGANVSLQQAIFIFMFSLAIGGLSMLPGGLGSTEATMVLLISNLGVDWQTAILAAILTRLLTLWFAVGIGFSVLPFAIRQAYAGDQQLS